MENNQIISHYFPYLRRGKGASAIPASTSSGPRQTTQVKIKIEAIQDDSSLGLEAIQDVALYGPGDILGFDASKLVVRTNPISSDGNFLETDIPFIEFSEPDFLWRYSTEIVSLEKNNKKVTFWHPWLTLIVLDVEKQEFEECKDTDPNLPPCIQIKGEKVLPNLEEAWRWAHVCYQDISGIPVEELKIKIARNPHLATCRLICARRLKAGTKYCAFVVPTFQLGVLAGLGLSLNLTAGDTFSWDAVNQIDRRLPYYYKWEFHTGLTGDFEQTLRLIKPRKVQKIGGKKIDVRNPGYGIKYTGPNGSGLIQLSGALQSADENDHDVSDPDLADQLAKLLTRSEVPISREESNSTDQVKKSIELRVVPPIYGKWINNSENADFNLDPAQVNGQWLENLNLDVRYRIAAGLGVQFIKENQEQLMEEAWQQLKKVEEANKILNAGQFGREISDCLYKRLTLSPEAQIEIASASDTSINVSAETQEQTRNVSSSENAGVETLRENLRQSAIADLVTNKKARKYFRNKKNIAAKKVTANNSRNVVRKKHFLNDCRLRAANIVKKEVRGFYHPISNGFKQSLPIEAYDNVIIKEEYVNQLKDSEKGILFQYFGFQGVSYSLEEIAAKNKQPLERIRTELNNGLEALWNKYIIYTADILKDKLNPTETIEKKYCRKVKKLRDWEETQMDAQTKEGDPMEPIKAYPEFHRPMYEYLLSMSKEYLLPGIENIPQNTVSALISNRKFIESFMIGLNHEFAAELRWRDYPTDLRGSYFRNFWDTTIYSVDECERKKFAESAIGAALVQELGIPTWEEINRIVDAPEMIEDLRIREKFEKAIEKWLLTRDEDKDIAKLHDLKFHIWDVGSKLGTHHSLGGQDCKKPETSQRSNNLVLVVRAEVLHRFPNTLVYLARKSEDGSIAPLNDENPPIYPIFEANLPPDILCLGFPMEEGVARKHFIVFEERRSEERFGLDPKKPETSDPDKNPDNDPKLLDNLSWEHFSISEGEYLNDKQPEGNIAAENGRWNDPAYVPKALTRHPVRMAIDLNTLLA